MVIIIKGKNIHVDNHIKKLGLSYPVYFVNNQIADLTTHKKIFPDSNATNIFEAEQERINYDIEKEKERFENNQEGEIINDEV